MDNTQVVCEYYSVICLELQLSPDPILAGIIAVLSNINIQISKKDGIIQEQKIIICREMDNFEHLRGEKWLEFQSI